MLPRSRPGSAGLANCRMGSRPSISWVARRASGAILTRRTATGAMLPAVLRRGRPTVPCPTLPRRGRPMVSCPPTLPSPAKPRLVARPRTHGKARRSSSLRSSSQLSPGRMGPRYLCRNRQAARRPRSMSRLPKLRPSSSRSTSSLHGRLFTYHKVNGRMTQVSLTSQIRSSPGKPPRWPKSPTMCGSTPRPGCSSNAVLLSSRQPHQGARGGVGCARPPHRGR
jgi:hypothetical protein